jgi:hypothetical protein
MLWRQWWVTVALIETVAVMVSLEVLEQNLPRAIRSSMNANCRRSDGSWSRRRERAERKAVQRLRQDLLGAFLIVLVPSHELFWLLHKASLPPEFTAIAVASWMMIGFAILKHSYFQSLKDLSNSIQFRAQQYHWRDLSRECDGTGYLLFKEARTTPIKVSLARRETSSFI